MKTLRITLVLLFALIFFHAQSDIIIKNPSSGKLLFGVQNPDAFPDFIIVGLRSEDGSGGMTKNVPFEVKKGAYYEDNKQIQSIIFVAIKKSYLAGKKLEDIDWNKDKNVFLPDLKAMNLTSNRYFTPNVETTRIDHKIVGFTASKMIIYKSQVTYKFQDKSKPDSICHFEYKGELTGLSKTTK